MSCVIVNGNGKLAMPLMGTVTIQGQAKSQPVAAACSSSNNNADSVWAYAICCLSVPPFAAAMDDSWADWSNTQGLTTGSSSSPDP
jgi:hypothetical protein